MSKPLQDIRRPRRKGYQNTTSKLNRFVATDGWIDGWMDEWMDGWIDGRMYVWMYGWMGARTDGYGWMGWRTDGWTDGWMDGCLCIGVSFLYQKFVGLVCLGLIQNNLID